MLNQTLLLFIFNANVMFRYSITQHFQLVNHFIFANTIRSAIVSIEAYLTTSLEQVVFVHWVSHVSPLKNDFTIWIFLLHNAHNFRHSTMIASADVIDWFCVGIEA